MSKKSFVVILILSTICTYGLAFVDFTLNISKGAIGLPFGFSRFNFFGTKTDGVMLLLDITFWFIVIWGAWKLVKKISKKK
jgi:hypothetical protein